MQTIIVAENVVSDCIKRRTMDRIEQKSTFDLHKLTSRWSKVKLFIFGGTNYLEGLEDNTYSEV